jgi:competence protein ComGC
MELNMKVILGSAVVIIVIAILLFFAIRYMIKQNKKGGCAGCPYYQNGECRKQKPEER